MKDCKPIRVPLDPKSKLKKNENKDVEMVKVPYQQAFGYWKEGLRFMVYEMEQLY
jgi:hypothetical protein